MKYNVISADGHIDLSFLPPDLFVSNAPSAWQDKVPRVVETPRGPEWQAGGVYLAPYMSRWHAELTPENEKRIARIEGTRFFDDAKNGRPHPTVPELRLKDQDVDGVDAEVIYGLSFVGSTLLGVRKEPGFSQDIEPDPELVALIYRIYNDWLVGFCRYNPQRLVGLACLPNQDPKAAAAELLRAAKMGLKGGVLEVESATVPLYYEDWDVLWKAAADNNMPISFHLLDWLPNFPRPQDAAKYSKVWNTIDMVLSPLCGAEYVCSIILSGACERYPDFTFVMGECGATWLCYLLDRLDHECKDYPSLKMLPSEYWRRQGHTTYQDEGLIGELVRFIGEDNALWGSDYPHPDSVWPDSQDVINRNLRHLKDPTVRRKLICDNAARLYGLG